MAYGLRNLSDPEIGLKEFRRVLKPGARAGILDFNPLKIDSIGGLFQTTYLRKIVVPTSKLFGLQNHYSYLEKSLRNFPDGPSQQGLALQAGFCKAAHIPIAAGQMAVLRLIA